MKKGKKTAGIILMILGTLSLVPLILAFTTIPFRLWYDLGKRVCEIHRPPDYIVLMGGGGMPSESGLIRCWYASAIADRFPRARVIIALPGDTTDPFSSVTAMKQELSLRGVAPDRIIYEAAGTNTRSQAMNIHQKLSGMTPASPAGIDLHAPSLLVITSPEHLYRAVHSFRKAGFYRTDGQAAWEQAIESDLAFRGFRLGGRTLIPDIGENLSLRYQCWTQMDYLLRVTREWFAIGYYRLKGWM